MAKDIWELVHPERDALAADLALLADEGWETMSLCDEWTVRDTVAHMSGGAMSTPTSFLVGFARAGFSFPRFSAHAIERYRGSSGPEALDTFRRAAHRTSSPPGPSAAWIGEAVIHAEDIRRPLGISHLYDMEALRRAADFYVNSNALIGSKTRINGLRLEATDTDWAFGDGPLAAGPMLALLMAMTGRKAALPELTGEGVEILRGR